MIICWDEYKRQNQNPGEPFFICWKNISTVECVIEVTGKVSFTRKKEEREKERKKERRRRMRRRKEEEKEGRTARAGYGEKKKEEEEM